MEPISTYQVHESPTARVQLSGAPERVRLRIRWMLEEIAELASVAPSLLSVSASAFPVEYVFTVEDVTARYTVDKARQLVVLRSLESGLSRTG
jgi:hypothetical protein